MKPFDLEKARAGAPVWYLGTPHGPDTRPLHFIGVASNGRIVVEQSGCIISCAPPRLGMLPVRVERAVNVYRGRVSGGLYLGSDIHATYSIAKGRALDGATPEEYVGTATVRWEE